jgi:RNA polymerase sigma-70 factor (ECF subfamily)
MTTTDIDHELLDRCLSGNKQSWEDFVDRFLGLVLHVIDHTSSIRSRELSANQRDSICEEVFTAIHHDDFRLLCTYDRRSNLATYLTVVVRRIVVRQMINDGYFAVDARTTLPSQQQQRRAA